MNPKERKLRKIIREELKKQLNESNFIVKKAGKYNIKPEILSQVSMFNVSEQETLSIWLNGGSPIRLTLKGNELDQNTVKNMAQDLQKMLEKTIDDLIKKYL